VLADQSALLAVFNSGFLFLRGLLLGAARIDAVDREADEQVRTEGWLFVDRTRSRENHPCVGLLQISSSELRGREHLDFSIYTVLKRCGRFVPKIVNEHPEAARNLCPRLVANQYLGYFSFLPFLALCPPEFEETLSAAQSMHGSRGLFPP
jgi:hypothetical protein